ncbi:hypothetical protein L207DRAFT_561906 [Hyaloscypha variabilis F]|uniref:Calcium-dependent phosphotriesterase n=1 Tax=Hyaloscypha variabilis (strain UAMH 11265 / GT02V1 / F) TaxID=1149755 RepID=A0A2J6S761_HYAVF|nr:hypothetical protein L207DRAFT_561906 [Hyaloscypha variabilis F]
MGKKAFIFWSSALLWFAVLWQGFLSDFVFITLGVGRTIQKIEEFPYTCKRIRSTLLESCEDIWLDEAGRRLYAACSTIANRAGWAPGGNSFKLSARDIKDHVSVLNIDKPGKDGMYGLHKLEITGNYRSATGGQDIDLNGFDIEVLSGSRLRFWMVNNRPAVDDAGAFLDASKVGANSTIEIFEHKRGSKKLEFVKTIWSEAVPAPNNVAASGDGSVFVTNDHDNSAGRFRPLQTLLGAGTLAYCHLSNGTCTTSLSSDLKYPNGIAKPSNPSNSLYIANTAKGFVSFHLISPVHHPSLNHSKPYNPSTVSPVRKPIKLGMPIDNLSVDSNGDIFVTGFPNIFGVIRAMSHPEQETDVASSVFRIRKRYVRNEKVAKELGFEDGKGGKIEHVVEKVIEDREGKVLPAASTVVHDVKTGNLWLSGFASKVITVCEPKVG